MKEATMTVRDGDDAALPENPYAGMTPEEFEAALTREDPRYPARKAAAEAFDKFVTEWIDSYEWDDGESGHYTPSETERTLLHDAVSGLLSHDEFGVLWAEWRALCGPVTDGVNSPDGGKNG
jgi:hypothetical protein